MTGSIGVTEQKSRTTWQTCHFMLGTRKLGYDLMM